MIPLLFFRSMTLEPQETYDDDTTNFINDDDFYVEAGTLTTVVASASAYDTRPGGESGDVGCGDDGCLPSLIRDNVTTDGESRWSCSEKIVPDGGQCTIVFNLDQPFYVAYVHVAFWNEDERTLQLQVVTLKSWDTSSRATIATRRPEIILFPVSKLQK